MMRFIWSSLFFWNMAALMTVGATYIDRLNADIVKAQKYYEALNGQIMSQQWDVDEMVRTTGSSGLQKIRMLNQGTKPFYSASHADRYRVAAIHDHPEAERVLGSGEMAVVLNGIEFRTRHDDFLVQMRGSRKLGVGKTVDVPLPPVPPEVSKLRSRGAQAKEMVEWFKAWRDQNPTHRDYRKYFKPLLCYLEGAWTKYQQNSSLKDPFLSLSHMMNSPTWSNLAKMARFTAYSGTRDPSGNLAYEPTHILLMPGTNNPLITQWTYGIFCHPIRGDLPLKALSLVDDLKSRMSLGYLPLKHYAMHRAARFQLPEPSLIDKLMEQIPGRDGYGAKIGDKSPIGNAFYVNTTIPLNDAYYHRWYSVHDVHQSKQTIYHRSLSDANVFMARTTDKSIAEIPTTVCRPEGGRKVCQRIKQRWTYAIPLEIVYMTPLHRWNPYAIKYYGKTNADAIYRNGQTTNLNGNSAQTAYQGVNSMHYHLTPIDFFAAKPRFRYGDTWHTKKYVRDARDHPVEVYGSGFYTILPNIAGVGSLRTRFPIIPVHGEDSAIWKEINALKEIVLRPTKHEYMYYENTNYVCNRKKH